ncbi:Putative ZDHHC-type palmitoyltransferase 5 (Zinc finger DHHC domain-containing protein 5), partial [Durusdinium trenchii]
MGLDLEAAILQQSATAVRAALQELEGRADGSGGGSRRRDFVNKPLRPDAARMTPLHVSCLTGSCAVVEAILELEPDLVAMDGKSRTPLHCAVEGRALDVVERVCAALDAKRWASKALGLRDSRELTPLHLACGQPEIMAHLLSCMEPGVKEHLHDRFARLLRRVLVHPNSHETLQVLTNEGIQRPGKALLDDTDPETGKTLLIHACEHGCLAAARLLLELGADPSVCDNEGQNVLHWACFLGHKDFQNWLLALPCAEDLQDVKDKTGKKPHETALTTSAPPPPPFFPPPFFPPFFFLAIFPRESESDNLLFDPSRVFASELTSNLNILMAEKAPAWTEAGRWRQPQGTSQQQQQQQQQLPSPLTAPEDGSAVVFLGTPSSNGGQSGGGERKARAKGKDAKGKNAIGASERFGVPRDRVDEKTSKIGGRPAWGRFAVEEDNVWPVCSLCARRLTFVCQVYAPVDEQSVRTIYLFACNEASCHLLTSWKALRLQRVSDNLDRATAQQQQTLTEEPSHGTAEVAKKQEPVTAFSFSEDAPGASMDDLEALLQLRDAASSKSGKKHKTKKAKKKEKKKDQGEPSERTQKAEAQASGDQWDPCVVLDVWEEPDPATFTSTDTSQEKHIADLIARYNKEQQAQGEAPLSSEQLCPPGLDDEEDDDEDKDVGNQNARARGRATPQRGVEGEVDPDETEDHVQQFQSRLELAPEQCLRYAYGTEPLWSIPKVARRAHVDGVPKCPRCHQRRVFELQLVPGRPGDGLLLRPGVLVPVLVRRAAARARRGAPAMVSPALLSGQNVMVFASTGLVASLARFANLYVGAWTKELQHHLQAQQRRTPAAAARQRDPDDDRAQLHKDVEAQEPRAVGGDEAAGPVRPGTDGADKDSGDQAPGFEFELSAKRVAVLVALGAAIPALIVWNVSGCCWRCEDWREEEVEKPVFIVGNARSGTTWVHRVLTLDTEQFTAPKLWEILFAQSVTWRVMFHRLGRLDEAVGRPAATSLWALNEMIFGAESRMHQFSLWDAEEDEWLMANISACQLLALLFPLIDDFRDLIYFDSTLSKPERLLIMGYFRTCVQRHLYAHRHLEDLRHRGLSGRNGSRARRPLRYLSKNPTFTLRMKTLLEVFPDCSVVVMVRDPYNAIPSMVSYIAHCWATFASPTTPYPFKAELTGMCSLHYSYPVGVSRANSDFAARVCFVHYELCIQDLANSFMDLYAQLGLPITGRMAGVLAREAVAVKGFRSNHAYSLQDTCGQTEEEFVEKHQAAFQLYPAY